VTREDWKQRMIEMLAVVEVAGDHMSPRDHRMVVAAYGHAAVTGFREILAARAWFVREAHVTEKQARLGQAP
jgi:hypothetical protein